MADLLPSAESLLRRLLEGLSPDEILPEIRAGQPSRRGCRVWLTGTHNRAFQEMYPLALFEDLRAAGLLRRVRKDQNGTYYSFTPAAFRFRDQVSGDTSDAPTPKPADVAGPSQPSREPLALAIGDLHPLISRACGRLFANGHFREGVERASVALQERVQAASGFHDLDGDELMNRAFTPKAPRVAVADLSARSGQNLQRGTHLIAQGAVAAIRNTTAHQLVEPSPAEALEQVAILSFIARRLDDAAEGSVG
jgi:uncharacterized protein (TIGR02391 family)